MFTFKKLILIGILFCNFREWRIARRVVQYTPSDTIGKSLNIISIRTDGQVGSTREKGLSIREMNLISGT